MTKLELIERLSHYPDDSIIVITNMDDEYEEIKDCRDEEDQEYYRYEITEAPEYGVNVKHFGNIILLETF